MANSRSESPPGCLVLYGEALSYFETVYKKRGRGSYLRDSRVRRGEVNDAWPGRKNHCLSSLRGTQNFVIARSGATKQPNQGQPDNEAGLKLGLLKECFQITQSRNL